MDAGAGSVAVVGAERGRRGGAGAASGRADPAPRGPPGELGGADVAAPLARPRPPHHTLILPRQMYARDTIHNLSRER